MAGMRKDPSLRRVVVTVLAAGAALASAPESVRAEPCGPYPPFAPVRLQFEDASWAGVVRADPVRDGEQVVHVLQELKGERPSTFIHVVDRSCPRTLPTFRTGMLIGTQLPVWDADELVAAARPLRANGRAPARFIVSTGSSRNSLIGLDARGRMVQSSVSGITYGIHAMCPGGRRLLAWRADGRSDVLTVSGLRIVRRGPGLELGATERVADASCLDPSGRRAVIVRRDAFDRSRVVAPGLD